MFNYLEFGRVLPLIVFAGIIILLGIIGTYNSLINSFKNVERSRSLVDVYLKKRFDLIPNLVECVKGYMKHEKETLAEVTKLRTSFAQEANFSDASKLNGYYNNLVGLAESYPEIKAGENFLQLQKELADVESEISASRRIYSNAITSFNNKIQTFPTNIFANILGYRPIEPIKFDVEDVQVKF